MKFWYVIMVNSYGEINTMKFMTEEEGRKGFQEMKEYYDRGGEDYEGRGVFLQEFEFKIDTGEVIEKSLEYHTVDDVAFWEDNEEEDLELIVPEGDEI